MQLALFGRNDRIEKDHESGFLVRDRSGAGRQMTSRRRGEVEGRGAAAVPEARPGRVGLFPVGGVVLGDAALELLPAHRFQLALAVGQPALHVVPLVADGQVVITAARTDHDGTAARLLGLVDEKLGDIVVRHEDLLFDDGRPEQAARRRGGSIVPDDDVFILRTGPQHGGSAAETS